MQWRYSGKVLLEATERIERQSALDVPARALGIAADALAGTPDREALLRGAWLGHAAHPMLTDVPLGLWTAASVVDLVGGRAGAPAARRLVGLGLLAALPTAATGLADWRTAGTSEQRVGVVHAAGNTTALAFYAASWLARMRGQRLKGILLAMAGGLAAIVSGYLGGHLSFTRQVGTGPTVALRALPGGASRAAP